MLYNIQEMEVLELNGEVYVKANSIAKDLGYTSDYVGQLCRGGKIKAQLVGRSWYVHEKSLRAHKTSKHRSAQAKTKQSIKESMASSAPLQAAANHKKQSPRASYTADQADLMPVTQKGDYLHRIELDIQHQPEAKKDDPVQTEPEPERRDPEKNIDRDPETFPVKIKKTETSLSTKKDTSPRREPKMSRQGHVLPVSHAEHSSGEGDVSISSSAVSARRRKRVPLYLGLLLSATTGVLLSLCLISLSQHANYSASTAPTYYWSVDWEETLEEFKQLKYSFLD